MANELEIRVVDIEGLEIRAGENNASTLIGYPIKWNDLSNDLGGFKERVMPGAISATLASQSDIRALVSHDPDKLLGRTTNNTLKVVEDDKGARVEIAVPDTSYARDLMTLVKRGDVKQMSFGFTVPQGGQRFIKDGSGMSIRELSNINLREVSTIPTPAYGTTSLTIRVDPSVQKYLEQDKARPLHKQATAKLRAAIAKG